jgi:chlorophyll a/b binding light-harvesting protein PcbE
MQTYGNPDVTYGWWVGNSVVTNRAGRFIGSHVGHTGIICFATGASCLWELSRFDSSVPMGHQSSIYLSHLASLGIGFDEAGVWTGAGVATIAIFHLIFSMVYGAAGLAHSLLFDPDLQGGPIGRVDKFKLEWDNPDNLTFILGHHLIFLGVANIWFVEWARVHGIYDPAIGAVRQVEYNLNLNAIWNHQFDFLAIDSLEDVMGGHAFLAFAEILGGAHHIATKMGSGLLGEYTEFKGKNVLSAEAILSWSLAGIGWMAIIAAFWCATNTTVYPEAWYGEPLALKFGISPYWVDTANMDGVVSGHTSRAWLSNVHYYLGFFFLQGHLWHAIRALGFDFKSIPNAIGNLDNAKISLND